MFVIPEMGGGGAERTFLNVLNHLDRSAFEPILVLYRRGGSYLPALASDVPVLSLDIRGASRAIRPLCRLIRSIRPDAVIATLPHVCLSTFLAAKLSRTGARVVLRETNHHTAAGRTTGGLKDRAVGWAYRHADAVISLSDGVTKDLIARYAIEPGLIHRIYNPLDIDRIKAQATVEPEVVPGWTDRSDLFRVVAVGSLTRQKGFDLLVSAMARISDPPNLLILGEGGQRAELEGLVRGLGLQGRVHLPGFVENPYGYIAAAHVFVLSSRWEGFGHVLAEAMACGTAVVATRCPSGPDEIVTDGIDGRLCAPESVDALAEVIAELRADENLRRTLASAGLASVARFDASAVVPGFEEVLMRPLSGTGAASVES